MNSFTGIFRQSFKPLAHVLTQATTTPPPPAAPIKFKRTPLNGRAYCSQYLWKTHCIDDQDKYQSVTDTDSEFTEYQTPRKKLQSIGV